MNFENVLKNFELNNDSLFIEYENQK